jgi:hypothetical protein
MKNSPEYDTFSKAMTTILKANPQVVKVAMEAEKQERAAEVVQTGKRGRGRPPKGVFPSSPSSCGRDI